MKKIKQAILWIVIATGISSIVLQLISIREFLARFQGNEFVIALILFNWLALGACGTFFAKWITRRWFQPSIDRLVRLSLLLAVLSIVQIVAIRIAYDLIFIRGSSVGFYPTFLYIFLILAPYCLLLGFVLPFSLFTLRILSPAYPGTGIYITDNIGDMIGGLIFSFALVYLVTPFTALCIANLPLIGASLMLAFHNQTLKLKLTAMGSAAALVLLGGTLMEEATLSRTGAELISYSESRYGRIEVHQEYEMRTLFIDGVPLFTNQNQHMAEEIIHYPLAQIDAPRRLLVIGGEGGIMQEIEKYSPETTDYVELDPEVTKAELHFDLIKRIPGLRIIHQDGRAYLKHTRRTYDAIILNLPEPETFQLNRFFTGQFYRLVKHRLAAGGIFSFSMEGYDNYLPDLQRKKLSVIHNTLQRYFEHILLLPGQKVFFLCSDVPLSTNIPQQLERRRIATQYISAYFDGNLTSDRIQNLNNLIESDAPENLDYRPQIMRIMFSQWFEKYSTSPVTFIAALMAFVVIYLAFMSRESYVLFTTGFVNMGCEILVIFAFQVIFGYIYFQIGIIVSVFLAGLLPGAWLSERMKNKSRQSLLMTDILLILLPGSFLAGIYFGNESLPVSVFMGFGFIVSLASGFQFPVALGLRGGGASAAAQSFSADLMGAACGTLLTSLVFIPYLGILWASLALMGIKMSSFILNRQYLFKGHPT